jgi:hypothetical protein
MIPMKPSALSYRLRRIVADDKEFHAIRQLLAGLPAHGPDWGDRSRFYVHPQYWTV